MLNVGRWYAVQVRPRFERPVVRLLEEKGYQLLLPMYRSRRRWADRVKEQEQPLFANYVFCRITAAASASIVTTYGVVRIVGAGSQPLPVDDAEVDALQAIVNSPLRVEPCDYFRVGQAAQITAGPLCGLKGVLVRRSSNLRFVLTLEMINQNAAVEVDANDLERA